jgi:arylsulfatase A-like enzyme/Flp pilus assembly protein TadD
MRARKINFLFPFFSLSLFLGFYSPDILFAANRSVVPRDQLNVLLCTIDTLRSDRLSCYQSPYLKTPNMDRLAEKGILFSRAFAHSTTTLPSHANILLGVTPLYHGVHDNANFVVREEFLTLAEHLKKQGYATAAFIGAYPLDSRFGLSRGFDVYDDSYKRPYSRRSSTIERKAEEVVESALGWLKTQNSPWFAWVHCYDPHDPYDPPEPFKSRYAKSPYDGEVAYVDSALGKLLDYLGEDGRFEKTLVVLTGDHGESLGDHGETTHGFFAYNSTLWIPLIMDIPGKKPGSIKEPVGHVDIFPTVCDVLGIERPRSLQGESLLPLIDGKSRSKKPIYFESMYPYYSRGWAPIRGLMVGQEKFIDSPIPELFDLEQDFRELKNLARAKTAEAYKKQLDQITKDLSYEGAAKAGQKPDRESVEKLRSLGYLAGAAASKKKSFGPEDDVKTLLPYNNKSIEAMKLYEEGKGDEAVKALKEVIAQKKLLDNAYSNLAIIYEKERKPAEAIQVLKLGMENIPDSYELFFNYITAAVDAGQFEEAISTVKSKDFPQIEQDPELWNKIGICYSSLGKYEQAIETFERAVALDSRLPVLFNNLGLTYLSLSMKTRDPKSFLKSLESFKKAIEIDPSYPQPYNGLGMAYRQQGNLDGAIYCWEKALELKADFGPVVYNLGLAYMDKKDFVKALRLLTEYRDKHSSYLSPDENKKLETLINTCKLKSRK